MINTPQEIAHEIRQHPKLIIADDFEISIHRRMEQGLVYRNGECSHQTEREDFWIGLRVLHRKRGGRASTTFRSAPSLRQLVENAFEAANYSTPDPWFRFPLWRRATEPNPSSLSNANFSLDQMTSLFPDLKWAPEALEESYLKTDEELHLVRKTERNFLNFRRQGLSVEFQATDRDGDNTFTLREYRFMEDPCKDRLGALAKLLAKTRERRNGTIFSGHEESPVLFSGLVMASLLKNISPWFFADEVQGLRSPLSHKKGQAIFSPSLTLVDDPTLPGKEGSRPFDHEGSPAQKTVLVSRGELKDFLYDTYTATRENRLSTGNLVRAPYERSSKIGVSNFVFEPSGTALVDLIGSVGHGVYVDAIDDWKKVRSADHLYYGNATGWRLNQGSLSEPLWNIPVEVNLLELFRRVITVGNDLVFQGHYGSPSILFEKVPLGF